MQSGFCDGAFTFQTNKASVRVWQPLPWAASWHSGRGQKSRAEIACHHRIVAL